MVGAYLRSALIHWLYCGNFSFDIAMVKTHNSTPCLSYAGIFVPTAIKFPFFTFLLWKLHAIVAMIPIFFTRSYLWHQGNVLVQVTCYILPYLDQVSSSFETKSYFLRKISLILLPSDSRYSIFCDSCLAKSYTGFPVCQVMVSTATKTRVTFP